MHDPTSGSRRQPLLTLANPPLAVSAAVECLAGALTAGARIGSPGLLLLPLGSALIFAAGAAFGHYFDRTRDAALYPERPLPSGQVLPAAAWRLAWACLVLGVLLTGAGGAGSALAGTGVALFVTLYAAAARGVWGAGFLVLAAARGLNFALGMTASPFNPVPYLPAALPVLLYAVGWALLRGSRHPDAPAGAGFAGLLHLGAATGVFLYQSLTMFRYPVDALPYLLVLLALCFERFVRAVLQPTRGAALEAVQYGLIGLALLEAGVAAGFSGALAGLMPALLAWPLYAALRHWPVTLPPPRR